MKLNITYTPTYEGCHRVYFKTPLMEEYCVYQDDFYCQIGKPKTLVIDFDFYKECIGPNITIECFAVITLTGYIQPCCFSSDSIEGRVSFTVTATVTEIDGEPCEIV